MQALSLSVTQFKTAFLQEKRGTVPLVDQEVLQGKSVHMAADTVICCSPVTYPDAKALRPRAPMNTSASYPLAL